MCNCKQKRLKNQRFLKWFERKGTWEREFQKKISSFVNFSKLQALFSDFLTQYFHSFSQVLCKRNSMQESEVQKWIEAVLNEPFPDDGKAYEDVLKDGVILCKLMNTLSPGSIPKINISGANFKLMENVSRYVCM